MMTSIFQTVRARISVTLLRVLVLTGVCLVGACANTESKTSGQADMVTASDESDGQKRAKIRLELALGYLEQGQVTIALDEVKQAIVADPNFAEAHNLRGLLYMRLNDTKLARDSFTRALSLNAKDGNTYHNLGWLACQESRFPESVGLFDKALTSPSYAGQAKTWLAKGICQLRMGDKASAETSFLRSFEIDAGNNPISTFNLANLLFQRNDLVRAQFYIRRINGSELANAESLWLGAKIEKRLGNSTGVNQLAERLRMRFAGAPELMLLERGAFDE